MDQGRREQFQVVVATSQDESSAEVEATLAASGYSFEVTTVGLEGLSVVGKLKPNAIVMVGFGEKARDWVLNFIEGNPTPPTIVAVAGAGVLGNAPDWLYDVAHPEELGAALPHRLDRALDYSDMVRLSDARSEKLGLSKAQIGLLSMVDVVTGLFNRRYFDKHLEESFAAAKRYDRTLALLVVRIENLHELQERFGDERTNDVLDTIALTFSQVIRLADTAARIDNNLFGFLLPETPAEGAIRLVERLNERFANANYPHDAEVVVTAAHASVSAEQDGHRALLDEALSNLSS